MATAGAVFVLLLAVAALLVSTASTVTLGPVRMVGVTVRRWGGYAMLAVGLWFAVLAVLPRPPLIG